MIYFVIWFEKIVFQESRCDENSDFFHSYLSKVDKKLKMSLEIKTKVDI